MELIIRKANTKDFNRINELFWQSDNYHYYNEPYIYKKTDEACRSSEYIESLINDSIKYFFDFGE